MRLAATSLVIFLSGASCSAAGPAAPVPIELGKAFSLKAGASAQTGDAVLRVGFDGVTADSRCPKGERCIRAGDAAARVWLQRGSDPKERRELRTEPEAAQRVNVLGHELHLVRLDPYPSAGKATEAADYVATLTLDRGGGADPDR